MGDLRSVAAEAGNLSVVEQHLGDLSRAKDLAEESPRIAHRLGDTWLTPYCLNSLAAIAVATPDYERAATLLSAADRMVTEQGAAWPPDEGPHFEHSRAAAAQALNPAAYEQALVGWAGIRHRPSGHLRPRINIAGTVRRTRRLNRSLCLVCLDSGALCDHPDVGIAFDDGLVLDTARFELRRNGRPVPIEPQTFEVLSYLVSHRDRVVSKEELMDAVWGGRFVTEAAVTSRIKQARRAMGDDGRDQKLIRTVHSRGYRFVADVNVEAPSEPPAAPPDRGPAGETAPIRYTISDGLHIAYQVTGGGELDIVLISGFVSHLELDWADDRHAHFLDRLGSMGRLIRFDKRGTGMSDRPAGLPDLEMRMHDVLAVMDAVGSRRAVLCGYSEGGPMAILMAATHPERVSSLVLYGSYAKRTRGEGYPWAQTDKERRSYTDRLIDSWDWEADLRMRCPSGDPQMQRWWAQRMRAAATPSTIRALMDMNSAVDVRDVLGAVRVPTLVLHRTGDALFKVEEARYLADHIPSATLRLLEGSDHLVCGNPDQILDQIDAFLQTLRPPAPQPLSLAAVVAVAGESEMQVIDDLVATGGRARATPSGRRVALFDGPATAVRCGLASLRGRARLGVSIAEVVRNSMSAEGPGVRYAERIADAAGAGELWVSAAAGMLLAGSGVRLLPVSSEDNIPGQQLLRAVR